MRIVRGDNLIDAVWARDASTLWNALKRLMIPLYLQSEKIAVGSFLAVLFLLFVPFPVFVIANVIPIESMAAKILYVSSGIASALIYTGAVIEVKMGLKLKIIHAVFAPLPSARVALCVARPIAQITQQFATGFARRRSRHAALLRRYLAARKSRPIPRTASACAWRWRHCL